MKHDGAIVVQTDRIWSLFSPAPRPAAVCRRQHQADPQIKRTTGAVRLSPGRVFCSEFLHPAPWRSRRRRAFIHAASTLRNRSHLPVQPRLRSAKGHFLNHVGPRSPRAHAGGSRRADEGVSVKRSRMRACARLGNDLHYVVCTRILFRDARPGDVVSQFGGKPDTISTLVDGGSTETL